MSTPAADLDTLRRLAAARGASTSLCTLIVPGATQLAPLLKRLKQEVCAAQNIRDKANREQNVRNLKRAQQLLAGRKQLDPSGCALFLGGAACLSKAANEPSAVSCL